MNNQVCPNLEDLFKEVDSFISKKERLQPPRIGISSNRKDGLSCIADAYVRSVLMAGGAPVLVPVITDMEALTTIVSGLDGLLMSGGGDLNPLCVGEEPVPQLQDVDTFRDRFDLILLRLAANRQLPLMGICRGHQLINVAFGGSVYQDIYSGHAGDAIKHSQAMPREQASHSVRITDSSSRLFEALGKVSEIQVNSMHHQAVKTVAPEFRETAVASDGINEATEHPEKAIFSVQWHPEAMASDGDERMMALFKCHIEAARLFKEAKRIHNRNVILDSHTDTPMIFPGKFDLGKKEGGKVNLPFMEEGMVDAAIMVAYIPQGKRDDESLERATDYAMNRLKEIHRQADINGDRMVIARTPEEVRVAKDTGKKSILIGVENGYAIGKDIRNIARFKGMGVSYITLCHNGSNDICDSAKGEAEWGGLSTFGKEVVAEMNRLGILVDISHTAESTFYDALEISTQPIIASHSSARALCNHPRNLTDEQLKALAAKGGVAQICLYKGFINKDSKKASLTDAIRHINHIVDLIGIDHVGIGSDFDGDGELIGCRASNELINITVRLLKDGYSEEDIAKIWGGNLLRVMSRVQSAYKG